MYSRLIKGFVPITITCKGDYNDPLLKLRVIKFKRSLQSLLKTGGRCVFIDDVSPWNSIRIKLRLSHDASVRLRELAQQRNQLLAELGILSLQFESESETFTIVDVPSSSNSGGPTNINLNAASSSYAANTTTDALFSFLVGTSQETTESKPLAGTRRALPLSTGICGDAEFSSSPKIAKRASGIRRPRGSRGSRGSRGGVLGPSLGSVGSLETTSISPTSSSSLLHGTATGCDGTSGKGVGGEANEMNDVLSNPRKELDLTHASPLPQSLSVDANSTLSYPKRDEICNETRPNHVVLFTDKPTESEDTARDAPTSTTHLDSSCVTVPLVTGTQSNENLSGPNISLNPAVVNENGVCSDFDHRHPTSNADSPSNVQIKQEESVREELESTHRDEIPARQIPLHPLMAALAARSFSVVNGCSVLAEDQITTNCSTSSHADGEVSNSKPMSESNNCLDVVSGTHHSEQPPIYAQPVENSIDDSKTGGREDAIPVSASVNGNGNDSSAVTTMEVDTGSGMVVSKTTAVNSDIANEEHRDIVMKGHTASPTAVTASGFNGNHDDPSVSATISADGS